MEKSQAKGIESLEVDYQLLVAELDAWKNPKQRELKVDMLFILALVIVMMHGKIPSKGN